MNTAAKIAREPVHTGTSATLLATHRKNRETCRIEAGKQIVADLAGCPNYDRADCLLGAGSPGVIHATCRKFAIQQRACAALARNTVPAAMRLKRAQTAAATLHMRGRGYWCRKNFL